MLVYNLLYKYRLELIIVLVALASIFPTLFGIFIFDDGEAILTNSDVTLQADSEHPDNLTISQYFEVFRNDFWGVRLTNNNSHRSYRVFTTLTFRLDYWLWGRNPFPFHLINTIFHIWNCILLYKVLLRCLKYMISKRASGGERSYLAFSTALIFAAHPIHVEPLGCLVGRSDILSSFIFLLGFLKISWPTSASITPALYLSFASIIGALFKENAIVLQMTFITFDWIIRRNCKMSKGVLVHYAISLLLVGTFVSLRLIYHGPPTFQPHDNPAAFSTNYFTKISSMIYIWCLNIFLLLCPIYLCYDWSMGCVQLISSINDPRLVLCAIFLIAMVLFISKALKDRIIMFCLLISGITFLPSSNLFFTVGFVLGERNLYLPSIGWCLLIAYSLLKLKQRTMVILFIVTVFSSRSIQRSIQWTNQSQLFHSALDVCPNNAKIHYNLGTLYGDTGDVLEAKKYYINAINLKLDYFQSMNNLANLLRTEGNLRDSEYWLRKALKIKPDFAASWMNLGIVLSRSNVKEAQACYSKALEFRKNYPDCYYNLGNLFLDMKDRKSAEKYFLKATKQKSTHSQSWTNLVILLEQDGRLDEAKENAIKALNFIQDDETLHFLYGGILGKIGNFSQAEDSFFRSIQILKDKKLPIPVKFYTNLGVLYHRWGKYAKAKEYYRKALEIDPSFEPVKNNLAMLEKTKKT